MKRLVGRIVLLLVVLALVCSPAFSTGTGGNASFEREPTRITSYDADFTVDEQGNLSAVETVVVDFPSYPQRRGIFRFWDTWDPAATFKRRIPRDIQVTQDGAPATVSVYTESQGRQYVARVGSEYRTMPEGEHTYVIRYRIDGVIEPGKDVDTTSQFYWNLIPPGWAQRIDRANLTVHLPADAEGVQCAVGTGSTTGCRVGGDGTSTLTVSNLSNLAPRTPVTVKAGLDIATPDTGDRKAWPYRWDNVFGPSSGGLLAVLALAILAGIFGWRREHSAREEKPPFPLLYAPPEGTGPAQAAYILTEGVPTHALVATLLHMAESKLVTLDRNGSDWTLTRLDNPQGWEAADEITRKVGAALVPSVGDTFSSGASDVDSGQDLRRAVAIVKHDTPNWAAREGHMEFSGLGSSGGVAVLIAAAATFGLALFNPFGMSLVALIPGLFLVGAAYLVLPGSGTRRTNSGRDLWSRLGGFRRILSTPSAEDRFDFSGRKELYTAYIPWAVAFGVADRWAAKYRAEVGEEPPVPTYFGSTYGHSTGMYVNTMVQSLEANISSSISAYEASIAPQTSGSSSSGFSGFSGGGGGFSGGGGGGGGGGGSW